MGLYFPPPSIWMVLIILDGFNYSVKLILNKGFEQLKHSQCITLLLEWIEINESAVIINKN